MKFWTHFHLLLSLWLFHVYFPSLFMFVLTWIYDSKHQDTCQKREKSTISFILYYCYQDMTDFFHEIPNIFMMQLSYEWWHSTIYDIQIYDFQQFLDKKMEKLYNFALNFDYSTALELSYILVCLFF